MTSKPLMTAALAAATALALSGASFGQIRTPSQTTRPAGPVANTRITEEYARLVARDVFFWAWPMVNVYNRRLTFKDLPKAGLMGGMSRSDRPTGSVC